MATFTMLGDKKVYYEEYGQGKPIIVLNGLLMSTLSWVQFIEPLSANNHLILFDFLDSGQSSKVEEQYTMELQADVVHELIHHLGLKSACIVGISYGGQIGINFAVKYPSECDRLVLFNSNCRTSPWMKDIANSWVAASRDPDAYFYAAMPLIYSPKFYEEHYDWMEGRRKACETLFRNKEWMDATNRRTKSGLNLELTDKLGEITAPTLLVSCDEDHLTPFPEQVKMRNGIKNCYHIELQGCGHGSMYEQPGLFCAIATGFCNLSKTEYDVTK